MRFIRSLYGSCLRYTAFFMMVDEFARLCYDTFRIKGKEKGSRREPVKMQWNDCVKF